MAVYTNESNSAVMGLFAVGDSTDCQIVVFYYVYTEIRLWVWMLFGNFQQACHYLWRSFRIFVAVEVLARAWKQAVNVNSCLMWFFFSICGRQQILRCIIINHSCYHKQIACNRQLEPIQFQADSVLLPFYFILLDLPKSLWKWWLNVMITHHVAVFQGTIETVRLQVRCTWSQS